MLWKVDLTIFMSIYIFDLSTSIRSVRYVEYRPPVILPTVDNLTLSARTDYELTCVGHKPISWVLPLDVHNKDVSSRMKILYSHSDDTGYSVQLQLQHLVYTDTGSYVCRFNDSQDTSTTESKDQIYIFVFDSIHLLTQSGFDFQQSVAYKSAEIPCRPTHPNVSVSLTLQGKGPVNTDDTFIKFNPQVGFIISPVLPEHSGQYWCVAKYDEKSNEYGISLNVLMQTSYVPPPSLHRTSGGHTSIGETLVMTCSVSVSWSVMVSLSWNLPNPSALPPRLLLPDPVSRNVSVGGTHLKVVEQKLVLHNVDKEDQGSYACLVMDHSDNKQVRREFIRIYDAGQSFLRVWHDGFSTLHRSSDNRDESVQWVVEIASHPPPTVTWYDPDGNVIEEGESEGRFVQTVMAKTSRSMLRLSNIKLEDSGEYRIKVTNEDHEKTESFTLIVTDKPKINLKVLDQSESGLYQFGVHHTLRCLASGYPAPKVSWTFKSCQSFDNCNGEPENLMTTKEINGRVETESLLSVVATRSGVYTCMGCNEDCEMAQVKMFVTKTPEGFHVNGPTKAVEGDMVELGCTASKYNYTNDSLVWYKQVGTEYVQVKDIFFNLFQNIGLETKSGIFEMFPSEFDVGKGLRFGSVRPEDSGVYVCRARIHGLNKRHNMIIDETIVERQMQLTVRKMEIPEFVETLNMNNGITYVKQDGETVEMKCIVQGVPKPKVNWFLNDTAIDFDRDINYQLFEDGQALRISTVVAVKNEGTFSCRASSRAGVAHLEQTIVKVESPKVYETNMVGSQQIIDTDFEIEVEPSANITFTCRSHGNPEPVITWMLDNKLIIGSNTRLMSDKRQTLILLNVGTKDEGRYECVASNIGGSVTRYQMVKLKQTQLPASVYSSQIAIPIYICVSAALIISVILLISVKCCCKRQIKSPGTPPTPRLTQYEQPDETESSRLTPPSCHVTQPCSACHYSYNGLYISEPEPTGIGAGNLMNPRSCYTPPPLNWPRNSYAPSSIPSPMSDFTTYSHTTLPLRMDTLNVAISKRLQERQNNSPPLTAEF